MAFVVSAPGKVIVFGEHAVVHGKAGRYGRVNCAAIVFADVGMNHTWRLDDLPWSAFAHPSKSKSHEDRVNGLDDELKEALEPLVCNISSSGSGHVGKVHRLAATAFLYVLLSLSTSNMPSTVYTLRSNIPIGAGLGSSASISVCLAAAILHQNKRLETPYPAQSESEQEAMLDLVNQWAFVGELCIHGNPSGIDNTVATKGKAVLFRRRAPGQLPDVNPVHEFPILPMLLVDTKQSRSTAVEVAKVGALKKAHPEVTNLMLDAIDKVTESAYSMLTATDFNSNDPQVLHSLGELVRINHGILVALGVSHPKLERIREFIDHANIGYTKLTGAGGGGCAITILKPETSTEVSHGLEEDLKREGFAKYETLLGGPGVGILEPAIVGGETISQEMMINAANDEEVERILGVINDGWRFWKT